MSSLFQSHDEVYVVAAYARPTGSPITAEEERDRLAAAHHLVQTKYNAGVPLFTKQLFRDILHQFQNYRDGNQGVSVPGLDGSTVHFTLDTGKQYTVHPYGEDYTCIMYEHWSLFA